MQQNMPQPQTQAVTPELANPQQIQELQDLMSKVKDAQSSLVTQKLIKRNETNTLQRRLMSNLFGMLQTSGVDPANPESVRAFLAKLNQQSPDLLELFQEAFTDLTGGPLGGLMPPNSAEPAPLVGGAEPSGTLMDNFRNPQIQQ
jgi:hypothetical protein